MLALGSVSNQTIVLWTAMDKYEHKRSEDELAICKSLIEKTENYMKTKNFSKQKRN